ncbi:hypothetical protein A2331_01805 [Candidatus Falkowbacteria bacterium RIFOXYB2_FULL_34_18]|uniref:Membrane insertase YidC/Oxa/ALB C-terminal domain-containing protein n=1 Tax=Candidatus Falkowbacteria bacterium RIFOXYD2_FULL_34_120 TaxID=1798007 RepID=A0A1F5TRG3_9BACT|nr:MAG: hypothetical protein A2331_01805 [Candidatus Falkowbacteria bacterium RIFOXYB2_FULL_34_18]OGF29423.1 MAG: hypothetical protein A2500_00870 [Candidatus Falkowbacteria bacterium RIFOXYC12_FULL_34_55]OGF36736.1 MAG: hypothetical protein A2466_03180 [Candidatus Falkowbacteria bacterium RIFOXYC2_FULL_34_220]OGF38949.1 MAG: hypothetical protein A2515_05295 [Candidatus Falkowbacteria bacterium RIFOXYD12_FULL_34_57]OGF41141.1 MAG: hypothetical protein A2531_01295 [Candidatus Falkowbacteria bact
MFQTFFYQPILNLLIFIYNIVPGHDLGIAIIILTIIIKLILWPLSRKALKSQKALQEIQPKIEEIKKKYKDKKEEMGKAMMQLYKDNKVNPFSSCLPLLIQFPFLIAVFRVFRDGFGSHLDLLYPFITHPEAIDYNFLGIIDLSLTHNIVLAGLAGLAQFWQTQMMMSKRPEVKTLGAKDEDMTAIMNKQMKIFMPIMTVMIGYQFSAGLALYWLVSTLFQALQQLYTFKKEEKIENLII